MQPGELYKGNIVERVSTDKYISAVDGRSSIGRLGILIHATAGFGDIGFDGNYTLEIFCVKPVRIYPDMLIGQIYFSEPYGDIDFLYFIHTNNPGKDEFNKRLSEQVEKIKENEKFRRDYAAMNLHDRDLIRITKREALAEGAKQKAVEAAIMLVQKYNATPETAAKDMNAPLQLILEGIKLKQQKTN